MPQIPTEEDASDRELKRTLAVSAAVATADRILLRDADTPEEINLRTALFAAAFVSKLGIVFAQAAFKQEHGLL